MPTPLKPLPAALQQLTDTVSATNRLNPLAFVEAEIWIRSPNSSQSRAQRRRHAIDFDMHIKRQRLRCARNLSKPLNFGDKERQRRGEQIDGELLTIKPVPHKESAKYRKELAAAIRAKRDRAAEELQLEMLIRIAAGRCHFIPGNHERPDCRQFPFDAMPPVWRLIWARRILRVAWILTDTTTITPSGIPHLSEMEWGVSTPMGLLGEAVWAEMNDKPAPNMTRLYLRNELIDDQPDLWTEMIGEALNAIEQVRTMQQVTSDDEALRRIAEARARISEITNLYGEMSQLAQLGKGDARDVKKAQWFTRLCDQHIGRQLTKRTASRDIEELATTMRAGIDRASSEAILLFERLAPLAIQYGEDLRPFTAAQQMLSLMLAGHLKPDPAKITPAQLFTVTAFDYSAEVWEKRLRGADHPSDALSKLEHAIRTAIGAESPGTKTAKERAAKERSPQLFQSGDLSEGRWLKVQVPLTAIANVISYPIDQVRGLLGPGGLSQYSRERWSVNIDQFKEGAPLGQEYRDKFITLEKMELGKKK